MLVAPAQVASCWVPRRVRQASRGLPPPSVSPTGRGVAKAGLVLRLKAACPPPLQSHDRFVPRWDTCALAPATAPSSDPQVLSHDLWSNDAATLPPGRPPARVSRGWCREAPRGSLRCEFRGWMPCAWTAQASSSRGKRASDSWGTRSKLMGPPGRWPRPETSAPRSYLLRGAIGARLVSRSPVKGTGARPSPSPERPPRSESPNPRCEHKAGAHLRNSGGSDKYRDRKVVLLLSRAQQLLITCSWSRDSAQIDQTSPSEAKHWPSQSLVGQGQLWPK